MIYGRGAERAVLDRLLDGAIHGHSGALVIRGGAGIGKSTMLQYASDRAAVLGGPVRRGVGIETKAELPYAALHLILHPYLYSYPYPYPYPYPYLSHLDALPDRAGAVALRCRARMAPGDSADDLFQLGVAFRADLRRIDFR